MPHGGQTDGFGKCIADGDGDAGLSCSAVTQGALGVLEGGQTTLEVEP